MVRAVTTNSQDGAIFVFLIVKNELLVKSRQNFLNNSLYYQRAIAATSSLSHFRSNMMF